MLSRQHLHRPQDPQRLQHPLLLPRERRRHGLASDATIGPVMSALRNVLRSQTLARASVGLVYRSPHSLEDLLELLPKPFQLGDLIRHRIKLRPNQRAKPRTKRGVPASVECVHQCLELLERQPQ